MDESYPHYVRTKPNAIKILELYLNELIDMGGQNFSIKCLNCHKPCHVNVMYCGICYHLLTKQLKDSSSFCN